MPNEELNTDKVYDATTQQAFQLAIKFYEADQKLNKDDREQLQKVYTKVTYSTLVGGWGAFFAMASLPFIRQKRLTGSRKGTSMGTAVLLGISGMIFSGPITSSTVYNWQLSGLQETNPRCYEVAKILKPSESVKWMLYYQMSKDNPNTIMKDPRSKEAEELRNKSPLQNRDVMGLHTGPRAEIAKNERLKKEQAKNPQPTTPQTEFSEDPFGEEKQSESVATSSWDRIRSQNGISSGYQSSGQPGSSWNRVRQDSTTQTQANPFTTNVYKPNQDDGDQIEEKQDEFDQLLEKERHFGEDETSKEKTW
ncbi:putative membrane protein [Wickerhamomyces ciferrii]|uniref:Membrane protein n=1 Tax=Wickerhamomyces ciferrii (strain ATCC 14091 / BCRC 22168 / CBS 111 / JCM 3599 / NBRC 0793 / NRRL Y-1031 F-60-10) TaxID=1206466 RepID=K0KMD8_WICCF|nr:uncharacterized protein BN7_2910 [Wickerhamomyces ciferrii]CCH43362.1 putative membrane protein [Wickerhamomyces ciferrii]